MKSLFKPKTVTVATLAFVMALMTIFDSCKTPDAIASKTGAQLWAENCNRCHNAPSPAIYSDAQWEVVGEHMRYKANLTDQEVQKVVAFLKSAN